MSQPKAMWGPCRPSLLPLLVAGTIGLPVALHRLRTHLQLVVPDQRSKHPPREEEVVRRPGGVQRRKLPPEGQEHHERQQGGECGGGKEREQHCQRWVDVNGWLRVAGRGAVCGVSAAGCRPWDDVWWSWRQRQTRRYLMASHLPAAHVLRARTAAACQLFKTGIARSHRGSVISRRPRGWPRLAAGAAPQPCLSTGLRLGGSPSLHAHERHRL